MAKRVSAAETRAWVEEHLRRRPELGLGHAMANLILEPRNPFDRRARRRLKKDFMILASLLAVVVSAFVYFNFIR